MFRRGTVAALFAIGIAGLVLLLYPAFSEQWNARHATEAIRVYESGAEQMQRDAYKQLWNAASAYNAALWAAETRETEAPSDEEYAAALDPGSDGMMGVVEIPALGVLLPLYHGTSDRVLRQAAGHVDWSSLPVGGENSHCVISGHRGLPGAKLFSELDRLREGDRFTLTVLRETLTYEVDQIRTVEPDDVTELAIHPGKDECTLVTCTPYGVNTHRLLVRGRRVETASAGARVISEAVRLDPLAVAPFAAAPVLLLLSTRVILKKPAGSRNTRQKKRGGTR